MVARKSKSVKSRFESRTKFCLERIQLSILYSFRIVSPRPLSIAHLRTLLPSQLRPIKPVVFRGSYSYDGKSHLEVCLALRCFQRLSRPDVATRRMLLAEQPVHQRSVRSGPLVLRATPLKFPTCAVDRDRTGSRRSEPSSRAALIRELRNPWDRVQPQDATSRHRGAKPCRRCERSGKISLLSPG
jgi:hypothetical protein